MDEKNYAADNLSQELLFTILQDYTGAKNIVDCKTISINGKADLVFRQIPFGRPHPYIDNTISEAFQLSLMLKTQRTVVWLVPENVLTAPIWNDFRRLLLMRYKMLFVINYNRRLLMKSCPRLAGQRMRERMKRSWL